MHIKTKSQIMYFENICTTDWNTRFYWNSFLTHLVMVYCLGGFCMLARVKNQLLKLEHT